MIRDFYVGHFDPCDPYEIANLPEGRVRTRPKVQRPLPREAIETSIPPCLSEWIEWEKDGYVYCPWSGAPHELWDELDEFLHSLADEHGAIVLLEMQNVFYPPDAREISETHFAKLRELKRLRPRQPRNAKLGSLPHSVMLVPRHDFPP